MLDGYRRLSTLKASANPGGIGVADLEARAAEAMDDDLNTPVLIGVLFDAVRIINQINDGTATADEAEIAALRRFMDTWLIDILGIRPVDTADASADSDAPYRAAVELLLEMRAKAKADRDWATSDLIRDRMAQAGFDVKDTKDGVEWKIRR